MSNHFKIKTIKKIYLLALVSITCHFALGQFSVNSDGGTLTWGTSKIFSADRSISGSDLYVINASSSALPSFHTLINGIILSNSPDNPRLLHLQAGNYGTFTVRANGNVGILNNFPDAALEIGYYGTNHQLKVNGTIIQSSDERLKENIAEIPHSLTKLRQLRSVSYTFKEVKEPVLKKEAVFDEKGGITSMPAFYPKSNPATLGRKQFGLIAQEVEKLFPELVYTDSAGMKSLDYIGMIPLLLDAVKEQQNQIDDLNARLTASAPAKNTSPSFSSAVSASGNELNGLQASASLYQNSPNPFSQSTQIKYYLPKEINTALLCIYDMNGKQVKQITVNERGGGSETIQGSEFSAGIYLYALIADGKEVDVKRMILTE